MIDLRFSNCKSGYRGRRKERDSIFSPWGFRPFDSSESEAFAFSKRSLPDKGRDVCLSVCQPDQYLLGGTFDYTNDTLPSEQ